MHKKYELNGPVAITLNSDYGWYSDASANGVTFDVHAISVSIGLAHTREEWDEYAERDGEILVDINFWHKGCAKEVYGNRQAVQQLMLLAAEFNELRELLQLDKLGYTESGMQDEEYVSTETFTKQGLTFDKLVELGYK